MPRFPYRLTLATFPLRSLPQKTGPLEGWVTTGPFSFSTGSTPSSAFACDLERYTHLRRVEYRGSAAGTHARTDGRTGREHNALGVGDGCIKSIAVSHSEEIRWERLKMWHLMLKCNGILFFPVGGA